MSGVPNPNPDRARRAQATTLQAMLGLQPATTALAPAELEVLVLCTLTLCTLYLCTLTLCTLYL